MTCTFTVECVDLNHGPLPYQVFFNELVTCASAGQRAFARSVDDRQCLPVLARSATEVAREPSGPGATRPVPSPENLGSSDT
jgi:hypothetical protein